MLGARDTIVAVSSPPGRSLRGLVRVSGPDTGAMTETLVGRPLTPRELTPCRVRWTAAAPRPPVQSPPSQECWPGVLQQARATPHAPPLPPCELTLPALASFFRAPRSYTGQDLLELQCPGNPALLDRLVHRVLELGARLAEPGEFTFRAFVAGKLDLTQAEGVAATIAATSDGELEAASLLRQGQLGRFAAQLVDELATQLALVEAGIDFTDQEDVVPVPAERLHEAVRSLQQQLRDLLAHSRSWGALEALPRVVFVGPPSAGKSTLFNALLGRTRAVTSPMPGTTRDVLAEPLTLRLDGGRQVEIMLVDIAGLDTPTSALDHQVQDMVRQALRQADLLLQVTDPEHHMGSPERWRRATPDSHAPSIAVLTKSDQLPTPPPEDARAVSALTGHGLDDLRRLIATALADRARSASAEMLALQPRHEAALRSADQHLAEAQRLLKAQHGAIQQPELVAGVMRAALDDLAALGGRMTPDDVIGRIFATFCIGK